MIIWIASYPKSGNTWIRALLSSYLHSNDGVFKFDLLKYIPPFPSKKTLQHFTNDFSDIKKVSDQWIAAQDRITLFSENKDIFLKTHSALCTFENNPFTNKNNTKAVIYVVRDPRNVITSLSHHYSLNIEESYKFMINKNKIIAGDNWGTENFGISSILGSWSDHYKSWNDIKFAPILIIKYENLIKDTEGTFVKIINFLQEFIEVKIENKKILKTVNSCNFKNLVRMEKVQDFKEAVYSKNNNEKLNFFNLGKKNNWEKLLSAEIEKKLRTVFHKEMKELNYL